MPTNKRICNILVICLILIGCAVFAGCTQKEPDTAVVKTDAGYVSGINQDGLRVYHGIPFAAPPTGDLRWRPPAPVQPWDGVRVTKEYSATCPQPGSTAPLNMSEDCLYLNVWTPAKNTDEKLPVMVFFYGGGFGDVAGSILLYNGTTLAKNGVIVVTPDYRVGALGFLAHPQLSNESVHNSSGNYGILDQQAALRWVQRNIGAFGGDPSQVTIFGQSAGAESTLIHVASPESKGLYRQAIVESGPFWAHGAIINATHSKSEAEQFGVDYASSLGYSGPDTIARMREVSPETLINATPWPASSFWNTHTIQFEPTIDGWILPDTLDNMYLQHRENPVPLMIGNNANDGTTLSANANMTVPEYTAFLKSRFGKDAGVVLAKYPANSTAEVQLRLAQIMTDYDFSDSVKFAAGSMGDIRPDTYMYRYSYILPGQPNGAFHGSEALLLFGVPKIQPDPAVAANVVDLWTRFAKTGNPNGGMNVTWPNYTRKQGRYLEINVTPSVIGPSGPLTSSGSKTWKFVVFGDSPDPDKNTTVGVSPELGTISTAIAAENPDLAIYVGDLINGWMLPNTSSVRGNYPAQFANWTKGVSPIHNYPAGTGIPIYTVRGNHEAALDTTAANLTGTYIATVASTMPVNGPPGEEKLTYSFTHKGAKFIATDDYIAHNGIKETVNQTWVNAQLTQETKPFMFVFGHSPVYFVEHDEDDYLFSLGVHPVEAGLFWQSMVDNNVSAYFSGHTHMYVRGASQGLQQIISGNGGAEMGAFNTSLVDPVLTLEYPTKNIAQDDQQVGYLVVTVHEDLGTYDGVQKLYNATTRSWETGDRFTIRAR
ncbi:carboxylesterase family protein [Methanoregula sp.]|uniref:carboxylesterase family protein n=1 Tax=Methanoregula sp. TaxID=2052170 RepID=UPI003568E81D